MENNISGTTNSTTVAPVVMNTPPVPSATPQAVNPPDISSNFSLPPQETSSTPMPPPAKKSMKLVYVIFGVMIVVIIIAFLLVFLLSKRKPQPSQTSKNTTVSPTAAIKKTMNPETIMKVGNEDIFQSDMDKELAATSEKDSPELRKLITDKLITDSVILQQGQKDGLVKLDETVFNSADKDYEKRVQMVKDITDKINEKNTAYKGSVIAIWFHNNDWIGPKGLDASKKIAFDTITDLQRRVKNKEITMEQAGVEIGNNAALADVDKAYKSNAYYTFDVQPGQQITISQEFDSILKKQDVNQVSDVYLAKNVDVDPAKQYEALYYVGMITEKSPTTGPDFNTWLATAKQSYVVNQ